jgi:hypothetical protein
MPEISVTAPINAHPRRNINLSDGAVFFIGHGFWFWDWKHPVVVRKNSKPAGLDHVVHGNRKRSGANHFAKQREFAWCEYSPVPHACYIVKNNDAEGRQT